MFLGVSAGAKVYFAQPDALKVDRFYEQVLKVCTYKGIFTFNPKRSSAYLLFWSTTVCCNKLS